MTDTTLRGKLAVIGQGYVGLPLSVRAAEVGWHVIGFDILPSRIEQLLTRFSPVEDIGNDTLAAVLSSGRYVPSSDSSSLSGFDVAVICVPTPLQDGAPDLSHIRLACRLLAPHIAVGSVVILESTTYPGTSDEVVRPMLEKGSGLVAGKDFNLGYSPERIDPGNKKWRFDNTPRVVAGLTPACLTRVQAFYSTLVSTIKEVSSLRAAELVKLLENTFRHVNIALANEFAMLANDLDIDFKEVLDAAATKPFGYMKFTPGPGIGGHCIPIDPSFLNWRTRQQLGRSFRFVDLANDLNAYMPMYVVLRLTRALNRRGLAVRDRRILLLGMTYKKNISDVRNSPSMLIAETLRDLGAEVWCADPHLPDDQPPAGCRAVAGTAKEAALADAVLLLVDHDVFDLSSITAAAEYLLDCRYVAYGPRVEHL